MAEISTYLANKILDMVCRNVPYAQPATVYLALYTNDPTAGDVGTEVTDASYARQSITFSAASGGVNQTSATIIFPQAANPWGTVGYVGIRDALSGGNLLFYGPLDAPKTIDTGDQLQLLAGNLTNTLT